MDIFKKIFSLPKADFGQDKDGGCMSDIIPYMDVSHDGILFNKDGSYSIIAEISGANLAAMSIAGINQVYENLSISINSLTPAIASVQIMSETSDVSSVVEEYSQNLPKNRVMAGLMQERILAFKEGVDLRNYRKMSSFLIISTNPVSSSPSIVSGIFSAFSGSSKNITDGLRQEIKGARQALEVNFNIIQNALLGANQNLTMLNGQSVVNLLYKYHNPKRWEDGMRPMWPMPENTTFEQCIIHSPLRVDSDGLYYDGHYHKLITLYAAPMTTSPLSMIDVRKENYNDWRITTSLVSADDKKVKKKLKSLQKQASSMVANSPTSQESRVQEREIDHLLEELSSSSEKLYHTMVTVHIWGRTQEEVDKKTADFQSSFKAMDQAIAISEDKGARDAWLLTLPGNANPKSITDGGYPLLTGASASHLVPLYHSFDGHGKPKILFENNSGGLAVVDLFDKDLNNYNCAIFGSSGSGKSFFVNNLLYQFQAEEEQPLVVIIDVGASYKKLTELNNGQMIQISMSEDCPIRINPFEGLYEDPSPEALKKAQYTLEQMCLDRNEDALPKVKMIHLEEALKMARKDCISNNRGLVTTSDIYSELIKIDKELAETIKMWRRDSAYGAITDGPPTVTLNRDMICFEMKELDDFPDLQRLMLFSIISFIWKELMSEKNRNRKKIILMDECWKLLQEDSTQKFMREAFRTTRKMTASAICVSQSLKDLEMCQESILANTDTKFLLQQDSQQIKYISDILNLNENEAAQIKNLEKVPGAYSDVFMDRKVGKGKKSGVLRNSITPEEYWLFTSTGLENGELNKRIIKHNGNLLAAIKECASDMPMGMRND